MRRVVKALIPQHPLLLQTTHRCSNRASNTLCGQPFMELITKTPVSMGVRTCALRLITCRNTSSATEKVNTFYEASGQCTYTTTDMSVRFAAPHSEVSNCWLRTTPQSMRRFSFCCPADDTISDVCCCHHCLCPVLLTETLCVYHLASALH